MIVSETSKLSKLMAGQYPIEGLGCLGEAPGPTRGPS